MLICIGVFFQIVCAATNMLTNDYEDILKSYLVGLNSSVNESCSNQLQIYIQGLNNTESWALKMLDSSSKIPRGTFSSKNTDLGDFDLCLAIEETLQNQMVYGKYCLAKFTESSDLLLTRERNVSLFNILAICLPTTCSDEEIVKVWSKQATEYSITEISCQVKSNTSANFELVASVMFLGMLTLTIVSSTIYDLIINSTRKEPKHKILIAFSILTNGRNLFAGRKSSGKIDCFDGIRVLALTWIMLGHRWDSYYALPLKNVKDFVNWYYYPITTLVARVYSLNVNSFFLMGGAVVAYTFMNTHAKCNQFNVGSYYINRYLRLTPPLAAMILIHVTIYGLLGSGPLWPVTTDYMKDDCKWYWWSALLYIQNYANPLNTCIVPAWYLSVDMQLYVLSPIILIPLCKSPKRTLICLVVLITCVTLLNAVIYWNRKLTSVFHISQKMSLLSSEEISSYFIHLYVLTHTRSNSWLIGIILGYFLYRQNHKAIPILPKAAVLILWIGSFVILGFCILPSYSFLFKSYNKVIFSIWGSLINPAWSIVVFWIIFACANGYGGLINWFLSLPVFELLSRLSYCMYIVHFAIIQIRIGHTRNPVLFSTTKLIEGFLGDYIFTIVAAVVWYLAFEAPAAVIQSLYTKDYRCGICEKCSQFAIDNQQLQKKGQ